MGQLSGLRAGVWSPQHKERQEGRRNCRAEFEAAVLGCTKTCAFLCFLVNAVATLRTYASS